MVVVDKTENFEQPMQFLYWCFGRFSVVFEIPKIKLELIKETNVLGGAR